MNTNNGGVTNIDVLSVGALFINGQRFRDVVASLILTEATDVTALALRMTNNEALDVTQTGRLDNNDILNTTQNGRLTSIEALNVTQNGRLDAVETKNTAQDGRLDAVEIKNTTQDGRLTVIGALDVTQNGKIATLEATDVVHNTKLQFITSGFDSVANENFYYISPQNDLVPKTKAVMTAGGLRSIAVLRDTTDSGNTLKNRIWLINVDGVVEILAKNPKQTPYSASGGTIDIGYFDFDSGSEVINIGGGLSKINIGSYHESPILGTDKCIITLGRRWSGKNTLTKFQGNFETNEARFTSLAVSDILTWLNLAAMLNVGNLPVRVTAFFLTSLVPNFQYADILTMKPNDATFGTTKAGEIATSNSISVKTLYVYNTDVNLIVPPIGSFTFSGGQSHTNLIGDVKFNCLSGAIIHQVSNIGAGAINWATTEAGDFCNYTKISNKDIEMVCGAGGGQGHIKISNLTGGAIQFFQATDYTQGGKIVTMEVCYPAGSPLSTGQVIIGHSTRENLPGLIDVVSKVIIDHSYIANGLKITKYNGLNTISTYINSNQINTQSLTLQDTSTITAKSLYTGAAGTELYFSGNKIFPVAVLTENLVAKSIEMLDGYAGTTIKKLYTTEAGAKLFYGTSQIIPIPVTLSYSENLDTKSITFTADSTSSTFKSLYTMDGGSSLYYNGSKIIPPATMNSSSSDGGLTFYITATTNTFNAIPVLIMSPTYTSQFVKSNIRHTFDVNVEYQMAIIKSDYLPKTNNLIFGSYNLGIWTSFNGSQQCLFSNKLWWVGESPNFNGTYLIDNTITYTGPGSGGVLALKTKEIKIPQTVLGIPYGSISFGGLIYGQLIIDLGILVFPQMTINAGNALTVVAYLKNNNGVVLHQYPATIYPTGTYNNVDVSFSANVAGVPTTINATGLSSFVFEMAIINGTGTLVQNKARSAGDACYQLTGRIRILLYDGTAFRKPLINGLSLSTSILSIANPPLDVTDFISYSKIQIEPFFIQISGANAVGNLFEVLFNDTKLSFLDTGINPTLGGTLGDVMTQGNTASTNLNMANFTIDNAGAITNWNVKNITGSSTVTASALNGNYTLTSQTNFAEGIYNLPFNAATDIPFNLTSRDYVNFEYEYTFQFRGVNIPAGTWVYFYFNNTNFATGSIEKRYTYLLEFIGSPVNTSPYAEAFVYGCYVYDVATTDILYRLKVRALDANRLFFQGQRPIMSVAQATAPGPRPIYPTTGVYNRITSVHDTANYAPNSIIWRTDANTGNVGTVSMTSTRVRIT